jgi:hypothetical protein
LQNEDSLRRSFAPSIWRILDFPACEVQQLEAVMAALATLSMSGGH